MLPIRVSPKLLSTRVIYQGTLLKLTGRVMNGDMIHDDTERDRCRVAQPSCLNGPKGSNVCFGLLHPTLHALGGHIRPSWRSGVVREACRRSRPPLDGANGTNARHK